MAELLPKMPFTSAADNFECSDQNAIFGRGFPVCSLLRVNGLTCEILVDIASEKSVRNDCRDALQNDDESCAK